METLFVVFGCIVVPMIPAIAAAYETWEANENVVEEEYDYR